MKIYYYNKFICREFLCQASQKSPRKQPSTEGPRSREVPGVVSPVKPARTVEVKPIQKQAEEASLLGDEDEEDPNTVDLLVGVSCIFESRPLLSLCPPSFIV